LTFLAFTCKNGFTVISFFSNEIITSPWRFTFFYSASNNFLRKLSNTPQCNVYFVAPIYLLTLNNVHLTFQKIIISYTKDIYIHYIYSTSVFIVLLWLHSFIFIPFALSPFKFIFLFSISFTLSTFKFLPLHLLSLLTFIFTIPLLFTFLFYVRTVSWCPLTRAGIHKTKMCKKSRLFLNGIHKHSFGLFGAGTRPFLWVDSCCI
jgi:hypothetical protein